MTPAESDPRSGKSEDRLTREVRLELVMLLDYGMFDSVAYRVDGSIVTLTSQVRGARRFGGRLR